MAGQDVAYYTLPVILSFEGAEKQANSKLAKVFRDTGKTAGKGLSEGIAPDVDKATAAYEKLANKAKDSLGKVRAEEATLKRLRDTGASDDRIIRQEERLATARRNSGTASRDASRAHDTLKAAQRSLGDGSDDLGRRMGGLSSIVSKVGPALAGAGAIAGGAALVGIGALAAGVAAAGRELYDLGAAFDDTFDNLRLKTGVSGTELDALKGSVQNISSAVPLSIGEIGNVVAETSRALHLTGADLDEVAGSIANLGRLTGEDVDVRTLGKAFRGFGVDVKDQVPALDSLLRANQATGVGVNELLATVAKSGAGLRQFGFDFGESAALATQFEEAGLDSTKALQGMTKGLATLAKDGQTGEQALRDSVSAIKDLLAQGREAEALDLTNQLFGAKGGVQFFEAIRNGALDLDALAGSMSTTGDTIAQAAEDTDDFAEKWQTFKNKASFFLEPLATGVFDGVNTELGTFTDYVIENKGIIADAFVGIGDVVITFAEVGVKSFGLLSEGIGQLIAPVGDFAGAMLRAGAAIKRVTGDTENADKWDAEADALFGMGESLTAIGREAKNVNFDGLREGLRNAADQAVNAAALNEALGDSILSIPNGKDIIITDNTPETTARLRELGIEVENTPNGIKVTATTEEAQRILDQWRSQETGEKVTVPVGADVNPLKLDIDKLAASLAGGPPIGVPIAGRPGAPAPTAQNPFAGPYPRAQGGIYASYANGGMMPKDATIQAATGSRGLIQWAEPSTGGEAFIPLNGGERSRRIWAETGMRLMRFAQGGITEGINFAAAVGDDRPYVYGGTGPGYDCSGYMSAIYGALTGQSTTQRHFTTESDFSALGFLPGNMPGAFNIGVRRGGGGRLSHMAGTLPNGVNVESGGDHNSTLYGGAAKGAEDFPLQFYLPVGGGDPSGGATGASFYSGSGGSSSSGGGGGSYTPGTGPNGEAGYYEAPDAKAVREADQKVADADWKVQQAELRLKELDADAKESQRRAAEKDILDAKQDAADARADAADTKRGKFTEGELPSSKSAGGKGGGAGGPQLSELGSIGKSFLTETFGLDGSWLPDIGNLAPLKMADALLSAFLPSQAGGEGSGTTGLATSGSPFGLADVAAPALPPGNQHPGSGAAPGPVISNDMSVTFQGNVGLSPDAIKRQQEQSQSRAVARLTGAGMLG